MENQQFGFWPGLTQTGLQQLQKMARSSKFHIYREEELNYPCSENKGVISFAVTAKLICVFAFAYADCWFSCAAAHIVHLIIQRHAICMDDINAIKAYKIPLISVQGVTAIMCMQFVYLHVPRKSFLCKNLFDYFVV